MRTNVQFTKDGINYKITANVLSSRMTDTSLGLDAIRTNKKMSKYYWTLCFIVIAALLFFLKYAGFLISLIFIFFAGIIIHKSKVLKVKYTFDEDTALAWEHFLQETYSLCSSTTLWMEIGTRTNINVKYSAGASHTVDRTCINAGIINANRNTLVDYCIKFNSIKLN